MASQAILTTETAPAASATTRTANLPGIQALRGIAALMVVFYHANQMVAARIGADAMAWGEFGVDVFFVISGFVMVYAVERRPGITPTIFLRDRLFRIVPLYWIMTLALATAVFVRPSLFDAAVFDVAHILKSLFFIPQIHPGFDYPIVRPMLVPGWTLQYEMYFYLLLAPLVLLPADRRIASVAGLLTAGFLLGRSGLIGDGAAASFFGDPIVLEFVLGMVAARLFLAGKRVRYAGLVAAAALIVLVLIAAPAHRFVSAGIPAMILVLAMASIETIRTPIIAIVMRAIGDSSYSLYLSHLFVIGVINVLWRIAVPCPPAANGATATAYVLASVTGSVVAGILIFQLLERPLARSLKARRPAR